MRFAFFHVLLALPLFTASFAQANLLGNPDFEIPNAGLSAPNYATSVSGFGGSGHSSAADWDIYNNVNTTTTTELLASTDPNAGGYMLHVMTGGAYSGIYQIFPLVSQASLSVDVFVNSGQAWLALFGNGGGTLFASATSSHTGEWETLTIPLSGINVDEFVLYSAPGHSADFFVDVAYADISAKPAAASAVPEPATFALLATGLLAFAALRGAALRGAGPASPPA